MVENVEELRPKFEALIFSQMEIFEDRKIPDLETRTAKRVPSCTSERAEWRVHECAGVKKGSGEAGLSVGI